MSKSAECAAKCLFAVCEEMKNNGGSIKSTEVDDVIKNKVTLTDWEKERAGKLQNERWWTMLHFFSIDYVKAGFILKQKGVWYLTDEGKEAMKLGAKQMQEKANAAYRKWKKEQDSTEDDPNPDDEDPEKENIINIEQLEIKAIEGIKEYIRGKNPYEFQDMVAALLRAMGYYTPFVAPKGKDGGIDVVAYLDALGAKTPRIKVQVKHMPDTSISAKDIRALQGVLRDGDIGLFVTSGGFSSSAKQEASNAKTFMKLIDIDEFISLWQSSYSKMTDEDKNMLPLHPIAFLGNNES